MDITWAVTYRTAGDDDDVEPLLTALADLSRTEGAVVTVTDSCGDIVLDIAPDDPIARYCPTCNLDVPLAPYCTSCGRDLDGGWITRPLYEEALGIDPSRDDPDDDDRTCARCGDVCEYLSTDYLCDGCVAELATPDPRDVALAAIRAAVTVFYNADPTYTDIFRAVASVQRTLSRLSLGMLS